jgi:hypothetical protein
VDAVAVLGPRSCALELFAELRSQRFSPLLAVGLEGAEALANVTGRRFSLAAGRFPRVEPGVDVPADFYESLGRDAGTLVRKAWSDLGRSRRMAAEDRARLPKLLGAASVPLDTTEATGFSGKRRLPRRLMIREAS